MLNNQKTTNTRNNSLMSNFTTELIKNLSNNVSIEEIFRVELEKAFNQLLETELDCFLGYEKYSKDGYNTGDSRNGYYKRTFQTKYGELNLSIPRDRTGNFKQQTLPSHEAQQLS
jgi:transposase-like protein